MRQALLAAVAVAALLAAPGVALADGPHHHRHHHDHYGYAPDFDFGSSLRAGCATAWSVLTDDERRVCTNP
jgi:hypothetical protein